MAARAEELLRAGERLAATALWPTDVHDRCNRRAGAKHAECMCPDCTGGSQPYCSVLTRRSFCSKRIHGERELCVRSEVVLRADSTCERWS